MIKRWFFIATVWVLGFVVLGMAPTASVEVPEPPQKVTVKCRAAEPTCRFKINIPGPGNNNVDVEVNRAGPLPTVAPPTVTIRPPRITIRPPRATVTVPGDRVTIRPPRRTITVPGPTRTVRDRVPGPTRTITVSPPRRTVRETVTVGPPQITATSRPRPTVTITEPDDDPLPPSITVTDSAAPVPPERTRQPPSDDGTIAPEDPVVIRVPAFELGPVEAAGLGLFALGILTAIVLFAMWAGYYVGWKDSDKKNADFYRALRDKFVR